MPGKPDPGVLVSPGHIGVARLVHGDPVADVKATAAQIGRIDERRAGRVELRDKGILEAASKRTLDETACCAGKARPRRVVNPVT